MATAKRAQALPKLTMPQLVDVFRVSHITIINWKNPKEGVEHRKEPLPHHKDAETGRVTYDARKVAAWAKRNDVPMHKDPVAMATKLAEKASKQAARKAEAKPGPKPKQATKKAAAKPARAAKPAPEKKATKPRVRKPKPADVEVKQESTSTQTQADSKPEAKGSRRAYVRRSAAVQHAAH
jgi:hypothetical protein